MPWRARGDALMSGADSPWALREDDRLGPGDGDGVFGVRRAASVRAAERPAVRVDAQLVRSAHEPRLDRDDQAPPEPVAATRTTVVGNVGVAVHGASDAMSTELGVDGQAGFAGHGSDG